MADYVNAHNKDWTAIEPAVKNLRIEPEEFESVDSKDVDILIENYTSQRVAKFLKGVRKDLKL